VASCRWRSTTPATFLLTTRASSPEPRPRRGGAWPGPPWRQRNATAEFCDGKGGGLIEG
jgi:hypothetical protein